jgi:hypothetical protein
MTLASLATSIFTAVTTEYLMRTGLALGLAATIVLSPLAIAVEDKKNDMPEVQIQLPGIARSTVSSG